MSKQRYVIVRGQVFRWEEKEPFVTSGRSVLGAIECSQGKDQVKCHECGGWFQTLSRHLRVHRCSASEYKAKHGLTQRTGLCSPALAKSFGSALRPFRKIGPAVQCMGKPRFGGSAAYPPSRHQEANVKLTCRAQLVARIKCVASDLGHTPTTTEAPEIARVTKSERISMKWSELCALAGLPAPKKVGPAPIERSVLIELLRDFYVNNRRLPSRADWRSGQLPDMGCYYRAFGSLPAAYQSAGLSSVA